MKKTDLIVLAAIAYLYIPVFMFLAGWIKPWIAFPVILITSGAVGAFFLSEHKKNTEAVCQSQTGGSGDIQTCGTDTDCALVLQNEAGPGEESGAVPNDIGHKEGLGRRNGKMAWKRAAEWLFGTMTLGLCVLWCMASGLGGFTAQTADWYKHNVLLSDLVFLRYPIVYDFSGRKGVLSYYIAEYLPAAVLSRILPRGDGSVYDTAQLLLMLWIALGIFLAVLLLYSIFGKNRGYFLPLIFLGIFLFGTFVCPLSGLYRVWFPDDVRDGVQWLSRAIWIQYSSNITLLSYVFPQMVSGLVSAALFYGYRDRIGVWALILAPLVLHSAFVFLGMAVLMATVFGLELIQELKKRRRKKGTGGESSGQTGPEAETGICLFKSLFSVCNLASLPVLSVLLIYILGNYLQKKPAASAMSIEMINYHGYFWVWFVFEAAWLLWVFLLLYPDREREKGQKTERETGVLLTAASISLFLYPFFTMGYYNDLCMRSSIPALMLLCIMVLERLTKALAGRKSRDLWYAFLLMACLLSAGLGSAKELTDLYRNRNREGKSYGTPVRNSEDFYMGNEYLQYQYIDWETEGIISAILKQK